MPKRKCCEHPTKHTNSTCVPKGTMPVSVQLSQFLVSQYNMTKTRVRWLCPRCHVFELKEMTSHEDVQMSDNDVSTDDADYDDDVMMVEVVNTCDANEDDHDTEELSGEEEEQEDSDEEDNPQMDSGFINESKENDHYSQDIDEKSTDCESMEEEEEDASYEHEYRKDKAAEQLSSVFQLLKIEPIHDKYVIGLLRISLNDSCV